MQTLTFETSAKHFVLSAFQKTVDQEGYVVEADNTSQRVLAPDGQEVSIEEFAGIRRGSEIFIKSDILSLIELCDAIG